jgi:arylsulfatase A-like enzyme
MPDLKNLLKRFNIAIFIVGCCTQSFRIDAAEQPPNIVIIFADDLGYGDVGCFYEKSPFKTPNLDRMAAEGARLTSFYVPTPYCAPSRATLLTGRYPFRHGLVRNPAPDAGLSGFGLEPSELTIAELLQARGYATAAYGKWHLGHQPPWLPRAQGFDEYVGILYSNDMFPVQLVRNEEVIEYPVVQASLSRRYTDMTLDFIERNQEKPFFVYLPHAMPHKPLAVSDNFYTPETPDNLYADTIAELDHEVGRVLDKLKELELDRNTLVLFLSDNGPWFGGSTGGLRGMKARTWEGGLRVPMIARMPGVIPAGIVNDTPSGSIDVLPTICRLTGARLPQDRTIDGRDLMPFLTHSEAPESVRPIFGMQGKNLATIRLGKWKLHVRSPGPKLYSRFTQEERANYIDPRGPDGVTIIAPYAQAKITQHPGLRTEENPKPMQLFDLDADRGESHNIALENPGVVKHLKGIFDRMAKQVPDFENTPSDYLFGLPKKGQQKTLMRLIGGELRYDRIPKPQEHLLAH